MSQLTGFSEPRNGYASRWPLLRLRFDFLGQHAEQDGTVALRLGAAEDLDDAAACEIAVLVIRLGHSCA